MMGTGTLPGYSTLATRQHVAVDVLTSLALGVLAAVLSLQLDVIGKVRQPSI